MSTVNVGELEMKAGDTWQSSFVIKQLVREIVDGVEVVTRVVQDLTGWDIKSQWRGSDNPAPVDFDVTVEPTEGRVILRANATKTRAMLGRGGFDVEGVAGSGDGQVVSTFFEGTICCKNDVTRRVVS